MWRGTEESGITEEGSILTKNLTIKERGKNQLRRKAAFLRMLEGREEPVSGPRPQITTRQFGKRYVYHK